MRFFSAIWTILKLPIWPARTLSHCRVAFWETVDRVARAPYTDRMEVHFSPDQIAQLAQIAAQEGVDTEKLVKDAALRLLQDDEHFRAAVRRGLEQADRGEFIEEDEMDARVKRMFQS